MRILLTLAIAALFSFTVQAQSSSQMGPNVDCKYEDGKTDYVPSMVCKRNGGTILY